MTAAVLALIAHIAAAIRARLTGREADASPAGEAPRSRVASPELRPQVVTFIHFDGTTRELPARREGGR